MNSYESYREQIVFPRQHKTIQLYEQVARELGASGAVHDHLRHCLPYSGSNQEQLEEALLEDGDFHVISFLKSIEFQLRLDELKIQHGIS